MTVATGLPGVETRGSCPLSVRSQRESGGTLHDRGEPSVNRLEFETLRDLPDKRITEDIRFVLARDTQPNLTFGGVKLENSAGWDVRINGTYKPDIPSLTFNFVISDAGGPICRLDINGPIHKAAGRTHK